MDKYEFNIKVEQIKKLVNKSDFETAMKIADTIDWRRVRNANLLSMIASVYEKNEEYQEAKDILLIAFERAPIGKRLLYKLTQLALKQGNIQEAESYYREFCELAGDDSRQDILRYLILKAKGAPIEQLIHSLESYTSTELDEKWLYELADLYNQAGMEEQCVKTCDKIMLMFGLGQYVDKAMELKLQYAPLTKYQMDLVENRDKYEEKLRQVEQNSAAGMVSQEEVSIPQMSQAAVQGQAGAPIQPGIQSQPVAPIQAGAPIQPGIQGQPAAQFQSGIQGQPAAQFQAGIQGQPAVQFQPSFQDQLGAAGQPVPIPIPVPAPAAGILRPGASPEQTAAAAAAIYASQTPQASAEQPADGTLPEHAAMEPVSQASAAQVSPAVDLSSAQAAPVYAAPAGGTDEVISGMAQTFAANTAYSGADVTAEEKLVASVREAEVEASLAEEMSKISMDSYSEEPVRTRTRVLKDVKDLKNTEALADKTRILDDIRHIQAARQAEEKTPVQAAGKVAPACFFHMMAEARTPEKGLEIAVEALKTAHRVLGEKHPVAKITGEKLNQRGILSSAAKLAGKDLIIEEAGDLSDELLKELNQLLAEDTTGMTVVLVDNSRQLDGIRKAAPVLAGKFHVVASPEEAEAFLKMAAAQKNQLQAAAPAQPQTAPVQAAASAQPQTAPVQAAAPAQPQTAPVQAAAPAQPQAAPVQAAAPAQAQVQKMPAPQLSQPSAVLSQPQPAPAAPVPQAAPVTAQPQAAQADIQTSAVPVSSAQPSVPQAPEAAAAPSEAPAGEEDESRVMDIDEFAQYCCQYASQIDCSITGKSMLALYERIEIMEEDGIELTKTAAEDLIEEAADKAEKPSLGKRITGIFSSKYDKDGLLILKEEHFI